MEVETVDLENCNFNELKQLEHKINGDLSYIFDMFDNTKFDAENIEQLNEKLRQFFLYFGRFAFDEREVKIIELLFSAGFTCYSLKNVLQTKNEMIANRN